MAGCAAQTPAQTPYEPFAGQTESSAPEAGASASDSGGAQIVPIASETDAVPEEDPEMPADPVALNVGELVADREGTDGKLPYILLDSDGAAAINEDIEGRFGYLVDEEYCRLEYQAWKGLNGRILSVIVAEHYDNDWTSYMPYCLDLATGAWLDGGELLDLLGVDRETMADTELEIMATEFEYEFGSVREFIGEEEYAALLARTASPDNVELERVWLGDMGRLLFVARIYSVAGAEFYEYPMSAGYVFP